MIGAAAEEYYSNLDDFALHSLRIRGTTTFTAEGDISE